MTIFGNFDTPCISATGEARNLQFGTQNNREVPYHKNENFRQKGSPGGHMTIFRNVGTPLHILVTGEARNLKFGTKNNREVPYNKK